MHPSTPLIQPKRFHRALAVGLIGGFVYFTIILPLIVIDCNRGRGAYDQHVFHLVAIRQFARQWPHPNLADYPPASTPGYHLVLAGVARFISGDVRILRIAGTLFSVGLVTTLLSHVYSKAGFVRAILLCLPVFCSLHVLVSAAWLMPENTGWWAMLLVLLIALRPRVDGWTYFLGGLALLVVVWVRQSYLWVAAPLCVAVWIGPEADHSLSHLRIRESSARLAWMTGATLPAVFTLAWFIRLWHGTVPPSQRFIVGGTNPAGIIMALAAAGVIGVFYLPLLPRGNWRASFIIGAILGAVVGSIPISSYSITEGRWSGLWNLTLHMPVIANRSPLMIALAALGGGVIAMWLMALPIRQRWIWGATALAFGLSQVATRNAFQRYDEPMVMIAAAISLAGRVERSPRRAWIGPILLAGILALLTLTDLRRGIFHPERTPDSQGHYHPETEDDRRMRQGRDRHIRAYQAPTRP